MFCPKCGKENPDANKFCKNCGKELPLNTQILSGAATQNYTLPPNLVGQTLDGKYFLEARLGAGGMGDVYQAARLLIGDRVAIKILHPHLAANPQAAERFRREAQTAIRLKHRNVVALYDVGVSAAHNLPYLLMELAEGLTLRQIISQQKILPLEFVVTAVAQICSALDEAHRLGIVHRDIKPENIIACQTETGWHIKVLDFGIAKLYNQTDTGLTQDGGAMGTPQYMSPEQCLGETLDGRSDLYSVGIVLYEMLCGTVPFKSPAASAVAVFQVQKPPPAPRSFNPEIASAIEAFVLKSLEKKRELRPPTALQFTQELIQAATLAYKMSEAAAPPVFYPPITDGETFSNNQESGNLQVTDVIENIPAVLFNPIETGAEKERLADLTQAPTVAFSDGWEKEISGENKIELAAAESSPAAPKTDLTPVLKAVESTDNRIFPATEQFIKLDEELAAAAIEPPESKVDLSTPNSFKSLTAENAPTVQYRQSPLPKTTGEIFAPSIVQKKSKTALIIGTAAVCLLLVFSGVAGVGWLFLVRNNDDSTTINANSDPNIQTTTIPKPETAPAGMVYVAGGEFVMGTDDSTDKEKFDTPAHRAAVKSFYIDATEVTNEDYKKFVDATKHQPPSGWKNGTYPDGKARFPVTGVDWDDANAYAVWMGKRLPSEAEWEYAARGGDERRFPWGGDWRKDSANADKQRQATIEVGTANGKSPFGTSDMCGNAWEWTGSDAAAYQNGRAFDETLKEPKIIRGGYFGSSKELATTTLRRAYGARGEKEGYANTGFRCVKAVPDK